MRPLRLAFVGAGGVNFGSPEGPWNHAKRLVAVEGPQVVGVADPVPGLARRRIREWSAHPHFGAAGAFTDWRTMLDEARPDAVVIGVPPDAHGGGTPGTAVERTCAERGVAFLVEKPLSNLHPDTVWETARIVRASGVVSSVGYMLRYARSVDRLRAILADSGAPPRHVILRYACAYSAIAKRAWWDAARSGGPIIEQATHLVDLARYLAGEADLSSVRALALDPALALADMPRADDGRSPEADVPPDRRIPRTTSASWAFTGGCLGTLAHALLLHGVKYETDVDVWADGLHVHLADPYGVQALRVRDARSEAHRRETHEEDDPYMTELKVFLDAAASGDGAAVRSPYEDAARTHELTWAVTTQAERVRADGP